VCSSDDQLSNVPGHCSASRHRTARHCRTSRKRPVGPRCKTYPTHMRRAYRTGIGPCSGCTIQYRCRTSCQRIDCWLCIARMYPASCTSIGATSYTGCCSGIQRMRLDPRCNKGWVAGSFVVRIDTVPWHDCKSRRRYNKHCPCRRQEKYSVPKNRRLSCTRLRHRSRLRSCRLSGRSRYRRARRALIASPCRCICRLVFPSR
jgi:hypothetical protein